MISVILVGNYGVLSVSLINEWKNAIFWNVSRFFMLHPEKEIVFHGTIYMSQYLNGRSVRVTSVPQRNNHIPSVNYKQASAYLSFVIFKKGPIAISAKNNLL